MVSETEFERIVKDLNDKLKEEYPMCCGEDILVHDDAQMAVLRSLATVWEGYDGKVNVSYDVMRLKYEYL